MATPLVLKQGSSGAAVVILQNALNTAFMSSRVDPDGMFGPRTYSTVVDFQRQNGLAADGIVGAATWAKLLPALVQIGQQIPMAVDVANDPSGPVAAAGGMGGKIAFGIGAGLLLYWLFG